MILSNKRQATNVVISAILLTTLSSLEAFTPASTSSTRLSRIQFDQNSPQITGQRTTLSRCQAFLSSKNVASEALQSDRILINDCIYERENIISSKIKDAVSSITSNPIAQITPVAMLITANTVGAGMMVLPDVASETGMMNSMVLFFGIYVVNLVSGLLIAEVCIEQHEDVLELGTGTAPNSFKAMAEASFGEPMSNIISAVSIFGNWCVLTFSLIRAGDTLNAIIPDPISHSSELALSYAAVLTMGNIIFKTEKLSNIASSAGTIILLSFVGLIIPGLFHVLSDFSIGGVSDNAFLDRLNENSTPLLECSLLSAAPTLVYSMVYQNIVPTVAKLMDYSRSRTTTALIVGSGIPMIMYIVYCLLVVGGVTDGSPSIENPIVTTFIMSCIVGSTISAVISVSDEFGTIFGKFVQDTSRDYNVESEETNEKIKLPAVLLSVVPPMAIGLLMGDSVCDTLKYTGGYCSPFLYGIIPVALALNQKKNGKSIVSNGQISSTEKTTSKDMVPGGTASLAGVSLCSVGFMGYSMISDFGSLFQSGSDAIISAGIAA
mmetsp:Transcript_32426/g.37537  ORF Transcript_32426/g.37537 Transcript_32426/m.37537 type:complete len:550 (+) Transcript_32426:94-1743(+)|eukprot:CAMPEP_0194383878 /NCGR_PEP_ID=MMETSP0174-20130528/70399_1 /TAXON_ID=216777 /ORGANISM="Proboscia alata, Strain PI-D3" /LENGTH=549 /DNA_ID=CAMNT_0039170531 /DNA_START=26 /DNA_END=1675 /DNA_ORIENTATION=-